MVWRCLQERNVFIFSDEKPSALTGCRNGTMVGWRRELSSPSRVFCHRYSSREMEVVDEEVKERNITIL